MIIDVEKFVQEHQAEIAHQVNAALNRAGDIIQQKVGAGEVKPNLQDVLPILLYEAMIANTVATLKLVSRMLEENRETAGKTTHDHVDH